MNSIEDDSNMVTPYVGVHVSSNIINKLIQQKLNEHKSGKKKARLQKMNQIAKTNLYFFSNKDVDFENKIIIGTYYDTVTKQWTQSKFPFPDVYYFRRGFQLVKNKEKIEKIWDTFDKMNIPSINSKFYFNKWQVYQQLTQYKDLQPHLPETRLYKNTSDLKEMFNKSSRLFLKSLRLDNGLGVMCVTKKENGYEYSTNLTEQSVRKYVKNLTDLTMEINSFYSDKPFIVQKSIDLIQVDNRVSDLRCDVQRNGQGTLECVAHSVRVSEKNSFITNTRTNPVIYRFDEFFKNNMGYSNEKISELKGRLEKLLVNVYEKIEAIYGQFGEIGIDIGIDTKGNIWFIECNAKPGKNSLWIQDEETIDRAFLNPLEYAKYITRNHQK
jgi:hypothetical protein